MDLKYREIASLVIDDVQLRIMMTKLVHSDETLEAKIFGDFDNRPLARYETALVVELREQLEWRVRHDHLSGIHIHAEEIGELSRFC